MRYALKLAGLILAFLTLHLTAASARDVATSKGELSVEDLYKAAACGAEPGGPCKTEIVRWPKSLRHKLRLHIREPEAGFPDDLVKPVIASVRLAITEINVSGSDIQLEVVNDADAPLQVHMIDAAWGDRIVDSGDPVLDGAKMRATATSLRLAPGGNDIEKASIAVSGNIAPDIVRAAVLKALLQALGFRYAVDNPFYVGKSVFTELGHDIFNIRRQDMLALRLQYPTGCKKASDCL